MTIVPVKVEYFFEMMNHKMKAVTVHTEDTREISYYFDEKLISERTISSGELLSDDDVIRNLVENYANNHNDKLADIFKNHRDKVLLTGRSLEIIIENTGISITAFVEIEKEVYKINLSANKGSDVFTGKFAAVNFSEVLEKLRIFNNTLEGLSTKLASRISELSDDQVEQWIKWADK